MVHVRSSSATAPPPPLVLSPLIRPFTYRGSKATVTLDPPAKRVHGVFGQPKLWLGGLLRRQAANIRRLSVAAAAVPSDAATAAQLSTLQSVHSQLEALLESVTCIHLRVTEDGTAQLGLAQGSSDEESTLPPGTRSYSLGRMPRWARKLYRYMHKVVDTVRSRTPMLVVLAGPVRTALMSNLPKADVALRLEGGWKVRYALGTQRITLQRTNSGDAPTQAVLSLAEGDVGSAPGGVVALKDGVWSPLAPSQREDLLPLVRETQSRLVTALRLWERVLTTRDTLSGRMQAGNPQPGDAALLASLSALPVVVRDPATPPPPAPALKVVRARKRRDGGVKLGLSDGSTVRLSPDGTRVSAEEPGAGSVVSSGSASTAGSKTATWHISSVPAFLAPRVAAASAFFQARRAARGSRQEVS